VIFDKNQNYPWGVGLYKNLTFNNCNINLKYIYLFSCENLKINKSILENSLLTENISNSNNICIEINDSTISTTLLGPFEAINSLKLKNITCL